MMTQNTYPRTIDNGAGEQLTFTNPVKDKFSDPIEIKNLVQPNSGPPMHLHFKQKESITVIEGKIGVQLKGKEKQFYEKGETITFEANIPHKFWNAGSKPLICRGFAEPANNLEYFLTEIYKSTKNNNGKQPGLFDSAFLLTKYKSEFDMLEIPNFVKKVIFPVIVFIGKLIGKYKKFSDSPEPL